MASARDLYLRKMEGQFKEWAAEFDRLKARGQKETAEAQLEAKRRRFEARLREGRDTDDSRWEEFKEDLERAWDDLKGALGGGRGERWH